MLRSQVFAGETRRLAVLCVGICLQAEKGLDVRLWFQAAI